MFYIGHGYGKVCDKKIYIGKKCRVKELLKAE